MTSVTQAPWKQRKVGWIGAGRRGMAMATRLARAGCDLTVYNRTRAKAEPLAQLGAKIADRLSDLTGCDLVFAIYHSSRFDAVHAEGDARGVAFIRAFVPEAGAGALENAIATAHQR